MCFLASISSLGHGLPHILTTQRAPPVHPLAFPFLLFLLCGQSILLLCSLTQSPLQNLSPHKKKPNPDSPQEAVTSLWFPALGLLCSKHALKGDKAATWAWA